MWAGFKQRATGVARPDAPVSAYLGSIVAGEAAQVVLKAIWQPHGMPARAARLGGGAGHASRRGCARARRAPMIARNTCQRRAPPHSRHLNGIVVWDPVGL